MCLLVLYKKEKEITVDNHTEAAGQAKFVARKLKVSLEY